MKQGDQLGSSTVILVLKDVVLIPSGPEVGMGKKDCVWSGDGERGVGYR